jgi:hypothetical protein
MVCGAPVVGGQRARRCPSWTRPARMAVNASDLVSMVIAVVAFDSTFTW